MSTTSPPSGTTGAAGAINSRRKPGIALVVIVLSQFMIGLDGTVVNIALPKIHEALGFSSTSLAWVSSSYTLAFGGLLLLGGRIGDILGRRKIFIAGLVLFGAASVFAGLANSAESLLVWRVVQGLGAAMAAPNSLALVTSNFEEGPERNKAFGAVAASYAASLALGLIAGGLLTSNASWRWVMFINVPFAALVLVLAPLFVVEADRHPGKFDLGGTVLSAAFMTAVVYGLLRAAGSGWNNGVTPGLLAAGAVLLIAFLVVESRASQPLMPLDLFTSRNRAGGYFSLIGLVGTMSAMNYFVSQYLQDGLRFSPASAGFAFLPMAAAILFAGAQASRLLGKVGAKPLILVGIVLIGGGMVWLSQLSDSTTYVSGVLGPILLFGIGAGLAFTAISAIILGDVSGRNAGSAASVLEMIQWISFTLGISVLVTVFGPVRRHAAAKAPGNAKHALVEGMSAAFAASLIFVALSIAIALIVIKPAAAAAPTAATEETPAQAEPAV
ncbi:MFS transporter [Frankia sp. AgB1.9]|uniref:MFS transporter n=1 Tax=unclassified Frankia TaxID=2632575 RepID=UPI0019335B7B|nr:MULTISPECIES: MFS transporter [unclassified Frankia]MBL7492314.1 MFS transporter [Frankia sp. AgW1.1]MBL7551863.1 MFS transporter [Frankia sp. AgB1.9]MBL7625556.1 MFS transporter [Frankia sp. AgB1.8]